MFKRIVQRLSGRLESTGRRRQYEADVAQICVLTEFQRRSHQDGIQEYSRREHVYNTVVAELKQCSIEQMESTIQANVLAQTKKIFEAHIGLREEQPCSVKHEADGHINPFLSMKAQQMQPQKDQRQQVLDTLGYGVSVKPSQIKKAGQGVFLAGSISAGTVVAFYPGKVYLLEHLKQQKYIEHLSGNEYARARFDQIIVNAKSCGETTNVFAVGHKVNHPLPKISPNVIACPFNFPNADPFTKDDMRELIPNSYIEKPSVISTWGSNVMMHSIVLIATCDLEDEELFLNYRYNPYLPSPTWFQSCDITADQNMWK